MARVYSTEHGRICPLCDAPTGDCRCQAQATPSPSRKVVIRRETKGRAGQPVTVIRGLAGHDIKALAKRLRKRCATGGACDADSITLQGDQRRIAAELLRAEGLQVGGA